MTFREWLVQFEGENSRFGDLAKDLKDSHDSMDKKEYFEHLHSKQPECGASDTFEDAWLYYEKGDSTIFAPERGFAKIQELEKLHHERMWQDLIRVMHTHLPGVVEYDDGILVNYFPEGRALGRRAKVLEIFKTDIEFSPTAYRIETYTGTQTPRESVMVDTPTKVLSAINEIVDELGRGNEVNE